MTSTAIVLTGLPASGKTTIGRSIATVLEIPLLDKDDFLEDLFEKHGVGDSVWRRRLSLESDELFQKSAANMTTAVLVSHWRPIGIEGTGTPTDWLLDTFSNIIEVYCDCSAKTAADRFIQRERHKGHADDTRSPREISEWMVQLDRGYPLGLGTRLKVNTNAPVNMPQLIGELSIIL